MSPRTGPLTASEFDETSDRRAAFELADACENAGITDDWQRPSNRVPVSDWTLLLIAVGVVAGIAMGVLS